MSLSGFEIILFFWDSALSLQGIWALANLWGGVVSGVINSELGPTGLGVTYFDISGIW